MSDVYEKISELARRRGFFWPSYEIYGGVAGFYDYGPYGVLLKNRIVEKWRDFFVRRHQDYVVEIETPIVAPSIVFEASGHVEHFTDPIVSCLKCGRRFRADHLVEEALGVSVEGLSLEDLGKIIRDNNVRCPFDGGELGDVKVFNLLFKTQIGPYEGDVGYLRPELAQGMFVAFKRVLESMRSRLPIGIAQIGRVGRNEISPRQAMVRLREFTIMEMEYFIDAEDPQGNCPFFDEMAGKRLRIQSYTMRVKGGEPQWFTLEEAVESKIIVDKCLGYWMAIGQEFMESIGVPAEHMFFMEKGPHERAHYSSQTFDQVVKVSRWGLIEVAGHSYRGSYDMMRHAAYSKADLTVFKPYKEPILVKKKRVIVDKSVIGRLFRDKAGEVLEALQAARPEDIEGYLTGGGHTIKVGGFEVPRDAVKIIEVEEKEWGRKILPNVVEPSFGVDRVVYVAFEYAYREREGRVVLAFPRDIAPVQAAVFPLVENDESLIAEARSLYKTLVREGFQVIYDDTGSIGRRYARADEIGVPAAFTVDYQTLEDKTVTMRDRDTWRQVRLPADNVVEALRKFLKGEPLDSLGTPFK
ncbi:MAG: glycine--tRNA ligase [Thermoprotei archaeon]|nr:glycine--tRNA ligase [Thermoprotei archaeon]